MSMTPTPRTAERYSLDEGCELANYNLTMDGATGVVSSVPGAVGWASNLSVHRFTGYMAYHSRLLLGI